MNNPLIKKFNTAPFSKIKNEYFYSAIKKLIEVTNAEIESITNNKETPTFKNTVEALDYTGLQLDRVTSIFFNLNSAETNDEIQKIAQEVSPLLSNFKNDLLLNEDLFKRVKQVYEQKDSLQLSTEQQTLLDKQYKGFSRNGANLTDENKVTLRKIDASLARLKLKFGENILAETNAFELHITDEKDLSGLPEGLRELATQTAKEKEREGWVFTLDHPSYIPFMTYSDSRKLRKKMLLAFGSRGFQKNKYNNQKNILEITSLRHQRAQLLGYETHAHFVLPILLILLADRKDLFHQ